MNVSLTPELTKFVHDKFKSGLYQTASEVVREELRLLEERDRLYQAGLGDLRREVRKGLDQLNRGEGRLFDAHALKRRVRKGWFAEGHRAASERHHLFSPGGD
jgi:antitoxin ParD1/3/4